MGNRLIINSARQPIFLCTYNSVFEHLHTANITNPSPHEFVWYIKQRKSRERKKAHHAEETIQYQHLEIHYIHSYRKMCTFFCGKRNGDGFDVRRVCDCRC